MCNITAWQAGNTDGYFVVTGHWIEEDEPLKWKPKSALLGFVKMNNLHNGKCLGGALFKVLDRLGIAHKVQVDLMIKSVDYANVANADW
jgi:hypothetical protein